MKKTYEKPDINITRFASEGIMLTISSTQTITTKLSAKKAYDQNLIDF